MRRIHPIFDLFCADPGEKVTVTVTAVNTVFTATFGNLTSGGGWTIVQNPTPADPTEIRQFTMPAADDAFSITYQFSAPQASGPQLYELAFAGKSGTGDGPIKISKPSSSAQTTLPYVFSPCPDEVQTPVSFLHASMQSRAKKKPAKKSAKGKR